MAKATKHKLVYKLVVGTYTTPEDFTLYIETMESLASIYQALEDYNLYLGREQEIHIYSFKTLDFAQRSVWIEWTTQEYKDLHDLIGID